MQPTDHRSPLGHPLAAAERPSALRRWLNSTYNRVFILYPLLIAAFEFLLHGRETRIVPWGIPLLVWGIAQYHLCNTYRSRLGGGGPGLAVPPERIVDQGIYAYVRNPMYLAYLIFLLGLAITFWSWGALGLLAFHLVWFNNRAKTDEAHLKDLFGAPYLTYKARVKRWIPGVY